MSGPCDICGVLGCVESRHEGGGFEKFKPNKGHKMSKKPRQKPVQISTEFHTKLSDLADAQGRNMKWIVEDALKSKYPAFKEQS